jgi:hypothetical protein
MNQGDWLRKRLRNPRGGCTPLLFAVVLLGYSLSRLAL